MSDGYFDDELSAGELEQDHTQQQARQLADAAVDVGNTEPRAVIPNLLPDAPTFAAREQAGFEVSGVETDDTHDAGGPTSQKRKRMRRGRTQKRNAQRRSPQTLFWHSATSSHGVWGGLVKRTDREKWATIYERRVQLLALDVHIATHRGMEELEAGAISCFANAATIVHAPGDRGDIIGAAVFIDSALPVTHAERLLDAAIERGRKQLHELGDGLELRTAWVQTAAAMPEAQLCDKVRGNVRVGLGWAEMATNLHRHFHGRPQEPTEQGGMWWPRISAAHDCGGSRLCELWLPLLSTALQIVQHLPIGQGGGCTAVADLKATVGCLAFPSHRLEIAFTNKGRPFLQSTKPEEELAVRCIHRVSMLLAEGDEANAATAAACPNLPQLRVRELVNQHGKTLCHVDPRDCGVLGKLLCAEAAQAAGIEVVKYRRHRPPPPDTPEGDFLQTVVIIFFGCSELEALSIIGLEPSEHSAILKAPLGQGGVMMAIYLLDFSKRYHGNPRSSAKLPPGAWAFRATPYATVHGATWAQRIELMPPRQAEQLLRSLARLPGAATLGARKRGAEACDTTPDSPISFRGYSLSRRWSN